MTPSPCRAAIHVCLVHPDPVVRLGLASILSAHADLSIRDEANGTHGPHDIAGADVVVAGYEQGVALAGAPAAARLPVVVVAQAEREWEIRSALTRGVRGYLLAEGAPDELAACVRAVHRGERHLGARVAQRLADSLGHEPLTAREEAVLRLVVEGLANKAIARELDIAIGTVKSHLKGVFDKLGVGSRTQAIAVVERRGLLCRSSVLSRG